MKIDRLLSQEGAMRLPRIGFGLASLLAAVVGPDLAASADGTQVDQDAIAARVIVDQLRKPFKDAGAVACIGMVTTPEKMVTEAGIRDLSEATMERIREAAAEFEVNHQLVRASACAPYRRDGIIHLATKAPSVYIYFAAGSDGQTFFGGQSGEGFHTAQRYRLQDDNGRLTVLPDSGATVTEVAH